MPSRLICVSFAKCENCLEVAGHENMTQIRRMTHVRTEVQTKLSFNGVDPMTVIFTFCVGLIHFHLVSLSHLALMCLTHLADLVSLTHLASILLTHLSDLLLTHLGLI